MGDEVEQRYHEGQRHGERHAEHGVPAGQHAHGGIQADRQEQGDQLLG
jgi:hypothetical protein